MTALAVTVITKNEVHLIRTCLDSVKWADEIIIVDSGSTDGTVEICREYTDKIMLTDWPGFGPQKNRALALAAGEWVLSLDADECVTPELRREMEAVMADPGDRAAFAMARAAGGPITSPVFSAGGGRASATIWSMNASSWTGPWAACVNPFSTRPSAAWRMSWKP